jgi:hypothetical protein
MGDTHKFALSCGGACMCCNTARSIVTFGLLLHTQVDVRIANYLMGGTNESGLRDWRSYVAAGQVPPGIATAWAAGQLTFSFEVRPDGQGCLTVLRPDDNAPADSGGSGDNSQVNGVQTQVDGSLALQTSYEHASHR